MTAPVTWSPSAQAALDRLKGKLFATTTEAGAVLRYDHRTIRKAIEEGTIPAVRAGSTYRIPTAWIREQAGLGSLGSSDALIEGRPGSSEASHVDQLVKGTVGGRVTDAKVRGGGGHAA